MTVPVVIALGSNLGNRMLHLRRAIDALRRTIALVRLSAIYETTAVDMPAGSPRFLNMVVAGHTALRAEELLDALLAIEARLGRRRTTRNASRTIDLDLVLYGAYLKRSPRLTLPHPRFRAREFVLAPLRSLALGWMDPSTGIAIDGSRAF
ncbi:MAG TPA: 2-amino-4-hydroxy-6-hydroxymethyldihydropteridine diphosphokinase [Thermoanaerobaculia bacterium]|nr:2-amino-4-hydroxy-6-hydroxymethyldihydropteridine diphosphokinase [Thermoanaerobaculia bacterium]